MLQNNISIIVPNYGYEAVGAKKKRIFLICNSLKYNFLPREIKL